jgi:hypothetical protein
MASGQGTVNAIGPWRFGSFDDKEDGATIRLAVAAGPAI